VSLKFSSIPLQQVEMRLYLPGQAISLTYEFIFHFHRLLADRYPEPLQPDNIETNRILEHKVQFGLLAPAGIVFASQETGLFLKIQANMLKLEWIRQETGAAAYPGFDAMVAELRRVIGIFETELGGPMPIKVCNITYTKILLGPQGPASEMLAKYYADGVLGSPIMRSSVFHDANMGWRTESGVDLRLQIQYGSASGAEGYLVQEHGGVELKDQETAFVGLTSVHAELEAFLKDSMSEKAKEEWGYQS
jgi:uncharacterized protein (TIGR04255 family)